MRRFTLTQLLGLLVLAAVACSLLLPLLHRAQPAPVMCANNLRTLWLLHANYVAAMGGRPREFPAVNGTAFWLFLSRVNPPFVDDAVRDVYDCPVSARVPARAQCEYRGPVGISRFRTQHDRVVGCDRPTNHDRGGNVLLFSGEVREVGEADPLWHRALEETLP